MKFEFTLLSRADLKQILCMSARLTIALVAVLVAFLAVLVAIAASTAEQEQVPTVDVLIVGNGPVALTLALLLRRRAALVARHPRAEIDEFARTATDDVLRAEWHNAPVIESRSASQIPCLIS